ncbi:hypothetical protein ACFE04_019231 [Oxalis oulophora]
MANNSSTFLITLCFCGLTALIISLSAVESSPASDYQQLKWVAQTGGCQGSMAECLVDEATEFEMDSEINRRILATTKYISYDALKRDSTPCSQKGASYYNCQTGAEANPYSRGCSAITRCRS